MSDAKFLFADSTRLVIKIGSALLVDDTGVRNVWLATLAADIAGLRRAGKDIILVSSGAVALGRKRLGLGGSLKLEEKQAAAAAGQALLIDAWQKALAPYDLVTAQLLLTQDTTANRRSYLNARATLETLLGLGAIPIINENDTVATSEIRYGDNDRLAAHAAQMADADVLVLLSDVDGLYTADPKQDTGATHIGVIEKITPEILAHAGAAQTTSVGSGGMVTKLAAAKIAGHAGCATIITLGDATDKDGPLTRLTQGAKSTLIRTSQSRHSARKNWIAGGLEPKGRLEIDKGAAAALAKGASLLPAGLVGVSGNFQRGDLVEIACDGNTIAQGIVACDNIEATKLIGAKSTEIEARLGYARRAALVHRDDLVLG